MSRKLGTCHIGGTYHFSEVPVRKAVLTLAVPTVISQLITVVYNMADTFFIGQLNDPLQVAAATIAMPCFMFLTAFANLFGPGGSSLISRCLSSDDKGKARHTAAFCIWTGIVVAFLYGIGILLLEPVLFPILGAKAETWGYLKDYIFWTIGIGAVPTVMNAEFAHLIRSEGYSKQAGFGVALGGILNIALDPLFIFAFGLNIAGAAIATMLSNLIAMLYFIGFLLHIRKKSVITLNPKKYSVKQRIPLEVVTVGLACPTTAINFMCITVFQAIGKKAQPLFLSLLRKGSIDIVFMLLLNKTMGISGIAWATPFADWIAFLISAAMIVPCLCKLKSE